MTFAWDEFFFRRTDDPSLAGLTVQFNCTYRGNDLQISRVRTDKERWATSPDPGRSRLPRLPQRPIDFVSLARIIPPGELRTPRRNNPPSSGSHVVSLSKDSVHAMSYIFEQLYDGIELHTQSGAPLAHCTGNANYSGFDMGSGENSAIAIFAALDSLPPGGLLLIEEIEHGFHPLAQERLVEMLTETLSRKKQQILCTTHSEYIVDALPQSARLLLNRVADGHRVTIAPTTRDLMYTMTGAPRPELTIYVEDTFAQTIVEQALPGPLRRRVRVVPIGSADRVVFQVATHLNAGLDGPAACILDGDCKDSLIAKWMHSAGLSDEPQASMKLPLDGFPPERWIAHALKEEPYLTDLAHRIGHDSSHVLTVLSETDSLTDAHSIPYHFATRCSVPTDSAAYILASCVSTHPELSDIRESIASRLNSPDQ